MGAIGNALQTIKTVMVVFPQAIKDNAEFVGSKDSTPLDVDTAENGVKWNAARVTFAIGATDVSVAEMNVFHSDDDSTYVEIAGLDFATDGTVPTATDDNKLFGCDIDLRDKKRYLRLDFKAGNGTTGTYGCAWIDLAEPTELPSSATERGYAQILSA